MVVPRMVDDLIEAGWYVLESDFDPRAFSEWKAKAFECVHAMMGPSHPYTQYFKAFVTSPEHADLLAGEGILNAVKEQMARSNGQGS